MGLPPPAEAEDAGTVDLAADKDNGVGRQAPSPEQTKLLSDAGSGPGEGAAV